jgi:hypothetical protein
MEGPAGDVKTRYYTALALDPDNLRRACEESNRFDDICQNVHFWAAKFQKEYGFKLSDIFRPSPRVDQLVLYSRLVLKEFNTIIALFENCRVKITDGVLEIFAPKGDCSGIRPVLEKHGFVIDYEYESSMLQENVDYYRPANNILSTLSGKLQVAYDIAMAGGKITLFYEEN